MNTSRLKPQEIEGAMRHEHYYLEEDDRCFYLMEYLARAGYGASCANQLIMNLKKPVTRHDKPDYHHKARAITKIACLLSDVLSGTSAQNAAFVPIPPSKARHNKEHDDRLVQILGQVSPGIFSAEIIIRKKWELYTKIRTVVGNC